MKETFITGDGSVTIYMADLKESYHSRHGALTESKHVFIEAGLKEAFVRFGLKLNILEIGFGTGLNALLTFQEARKHKLQVWYTALGTQALCNPAPLHLCNSAPLHLHFAKTHTLVIQS